MVALSDSEKKKHYDIILADIENKLPSLDSKQQLFDLIIEKLSSLPHFNWTGIYEYDLPKEELSLYPKYIGLPTDHIHIPKGTGVCGTAVAENKDIIIDDVRDLDNYLACSIQTRAELVVLIKNSEGTILGQIDVDSDEKGAFSKMDREYTSQIAQLLAQKLESIER